MHLRTLPAGQCKLLGCVGLGKGVPTTPLNILPWQATHADGSDEHGLSLEV
jgi:hypothetical protein